MPYLNEGPGHQNTDTSLNAAAATISRAATLRAKVAKVLLESASGMDSEQIADALGEAYASIQPRTAELRRAGVVEDSGQRHTGRFGRPIIVWVHVSNARASA